jgi:hypothetical protein
MAKIQKLIETDEGTFHWCSHEKEYRPVELFRQNLKGYHFFCDECMDKINDKKVYNIFDPIPHSNRVLEILGYDLDSDVPVSEQFIKKHKLENLNSNGRKRK